MTLFNSYPSALLSTFLFFNAGAQEADSSGNQRSYEDFGIYLGISGVKLSKIAPGSTLNFGFSSGGRRFKYGFGYGVSVARGNSGTQYLTAFGLTNTNMIEVPHDSKAGYSSISVDFRYFLKSTEMTKGSNFYANLAFITQVFSMVVENGKYDASEYYVQDDIFNISNAKINRAMGFAVRFGGGYQYTFSGKWSFISQLGFDLNFGDNRTFSNFVLPDTHALMVGAGLQYTFLFSSGQ